MPVLAEVLPEAVPVLDALDPEEFPVLDGGLGTVIVTVIVLLPTVPP